MKSESALLTHQYRYDQKQFWREPASVFFTVALPLIFLFLFVSIFGNDTQKVEGHVVKGATYYVPGIITLAVVSATIVNLAITFTILREKGLGRVVYGVHLPTHTLPGLVATVLVGTAACCALGFALTGLIPSEGAAPAITNAVILPLYFFSGIFIPVDQLPSGMRIIGTLFPIRHLFDSFLLAYDPATKGSAISVGHLAVLALWGVAGGLVAARRFRWTPTG
jgi:ABC-2 type transport system permease protein